MSLDTSTYTYQILNAESHMDRKLVGRESGHASLFKVYFLNKDRSSPQPQFCEGSNISSLLNTEFPRARRFRICSHSALNRHHASADNGAQLDD